MRQPTIAQPEKEPSMFRAVAMRLHPVFTQVRSWTGGTTPDGIEAMIEFQDEFGEPAKASGEVVFELFQYRKGYPDPRGARVVNPWVAALDTAAAQRAHWNRAGRTYGFQLAYPELSPKGTYVLTATVELSDGGRFFDRIILEPAAKDLETPATSPARQPEVRNPAP
jgi:hypothetical protein